MPQSWSDWLDDFEDRQLSRSAMSFVKQRRSVVLGASSPMQIATVIFATAYYYIIGCFCSFWLVFEVFRLEQSMITFLLGSLIAVPILVQMLLMTTWYWEREGR